MLDNLGHELGLDEELMPRNLENIGNTVSATLPILAHDLRAAGRLRPGKRSLSGRLRRGPLLGGLPLDRDLASAPGRRETANAIQSRLNALRAGRSPWNSRDTIQSHLNAQCLAGRDPNTGLSRILEEDPMLNHHWQDQLAAPTRQLQIIVGAPAPVAYSSW